MNISDILASLDGFTPFAEHLVLAFILTALFAAIYLRVTPYRELELIQQGEIAPAISLSGALLGFAIALSSAITHSISFADMCVWALIALLVQSAVFWSMRALLTPLYQGLLENKTAPALLLASLSIAAGLLSGASMSY